MTSVNPLPSGKKRAASKKSVKKHAKKSSKRLSKHERRVKQNRDKRANMTIAQCITFAIRSSGKKEGLLFRQIRASLKFAGLNMSNFIIKNTLKKMLKWKVVKRTSRTRYQLTGKRCPSHLKNKQLNKKRRVAKAQRLADRRFKNRVARMAKKQARNGRTFERCVHDLLGAKKNLTLNELNTKMRKEAGCKSCNKFVLKHVVDRLRAKKVVKIYQFRYKNTGNKFPAKKRAAKSK